MPRPSKGARLYWRTDTENWVILDGKRQVRTGTANRETADRALATYIINRDRPSGSNEPENMSVAEVLDIYGREHAPHTAAPERIGYAIAALLGFWADLRVSTITGNTCRRYAAVRNRAPGTVRRELGTLRAAVEYCFKEGYLTRAPKVSLPEKAAPKDRWLTRSEVASLIRAARSSPRSRHIAWFILIAVYTGTRKAAVLKLGFLPHTQGGWIDVENGVIHRKSAAERATSKRRPPVRMPRKLLGHMRRKQASGVVWAVEYKGQRVGDIKTAWARICADAGLNDATPHTLKHTAVTWAMQAGVPLADAAGYFGTSISTLERVYFHHHVDFQKATADAMDRRG